MVGTRKQGRGHKGLLPPGYKLELDFTKELNATWTQRCQQLIGILWWPIELERIEILTEVALMFQCQANPPTRGPPGGALPHISLPMEKSTEKDGVWPCNTSGGWKLVQAGCRCDGILRVDPICKHPLGYQWQSTCLSMQIMQAMSSSGDHLPVF